MKKLAFISILFFAFSCQSHWYSIPYSEAENTSAGMVYQLPRNVIYVQAEVASFHFYPGPYARYAKEFLNIDDVAKKEKTWWRMEDVSFQRSIEADPARVFLLTAQKGEIPAMMKSADNIIQAINTHADLSFEKDQTVPLKRLEEYEDPADLRFPDRGVKRNFVETIDTTYRVISHDSIYRRIPEYTSATKERSFRSKAEEAANFIIKIRKRRFKLEAAIEEQQADGTGIGIMLAKLEALEKSYLELFAGKTEKSLHSMHFRLVPEKGDTVQKYLLAYLDSEDGSEVFSREEGVPLELSISTLSDSHFTEVETDSVYTDNALAYRIPAHVLVELFTGQKLVYRDEMCISQLGNLQYMSNKVIAPDTEVIYDYGTGAIRKIISKD